MADNNDGPWGPRKNKNKGSFEDQIDNAIKDLKNMMPKGFQSGFGFIAIALVILVLWLASGFYKFDESHQAAVLRFGKFQRTASAGLNWHIPFPFEKAIVRNTEKVRVISSHDSGKQDASFMLTGDENIAQVRYSVQWFIKDLPLYLFEVQDPDTAVQLAAESIIREIIAQTPIAKALSEGRGGINQLALERLQELVDEYRLGIQIKEFSLQGVDPPDEVREAFLSVNRARTAKEQTINEAQSYQNSVKPRAEGDAVQIVEQAKAYKQRRIAQATGESARFINVLSAYKKAPKETRKRMLIEMKEKVLTGQHKVFFDGDMQSAKNVLPHLALPAIQKAPEDIKDVKQ